MSPAARKLVSFGYDEGVLRWMDVDLIATGLYQEWASTVLEDSEEAPLWAEIIPVDPKKTGPLHPLVLWDSPTD